MIQPKQGIHMLPTPDKYGQSYFLVRQNASNEWIAEGEKDISYLFAYDPKNPSIDWMPYFNLIPISDKQLPLLLSKINCDIEGLGRQKSFLEQVAQSQPLCKSSNFCQCKGYTRSVVSSPIDTVDTCQVCGKIKQDLPFPKI